MEASCCDESRGSGYRLVAGKALQDKGIQTAVLNLADTLVAGGMVGSGSGAQEESIFRRSNYCRNLDQALYPSQSALVACMAFWHVV